MIETDHQKFLSLEYNGWSQILFSKIIKGDWDRKCFEGNKNYYLQNFIHFSFTKFQLVLTGRFGDMVI